MQGLDLTLALERRLVNAWPSFAVELADGWLLRFAEGYSKRANSATPIAPGARLDPDLVAAAEASFRRHGIAPCFRLTGVEDNGADAVLAGLGYDLYDPSVGMIAAIGGDRPIDRALRLDVVPPVPWIAAAAAAYGGDKANGEILGRIVRAIRQPACFATMPEGDRDVAWGLAVAERGYVGLYDIVVDPARRGAGLGRRLVTGLIEWGRREGAASAYLQMRESNAVAEGLYRSLGFTVAYRYRHRVPGVTRDDAPG